MLKEDNNVLKYNHGEKSIIVPFIIYADLECLLEKMSTCHNNPEKSSTTKNTKKYKTFSVPIQKELDNGKTITYKIKLIDNFRFMASSLASLVDNLSEELHEDKCIDCKSCFDYMMFNDDRLIFRCFQCKNNYKKRL